MDELLQGDLVVSETGGVAASTDGKKLAFAALGGLYLYDLESGSCPSGVGTETTGVSEGVSPETAGAGASVLPQADNARVKISTNVMRERNAFCAGRQAVPLRHWDFLGAGHRRSAPARL